MKQTYTYEVNGFQIHAEYEEKDIETIFIPLLKKWKELNFRCNYFHNYLKNHLTQF